MLQFIRTCEDLTWKPIARIAALSSFASITPKDTSLNSHMNDVCFARMLTIRSLDCVHLYYITHEGYGWVNHHRRQNQINWTPRDTLLFLLHPNPSISVQKQIHTVNSIKTASWAISFLYTKLWRGANLDRIFFSFMQGRKPAPPCWLDRIPRLQWAWLNCHLL